MDTIRDEPTARHPSARSVGGLFSDLTQNVMLLLRQEVALAKVEILGKFGQVGAGAGLLAAAGLLAFAGLLYLMAAAMMGLTVVLPDWVAALSVGGAVVLIAIILALVGRAKLRAESLVPSRTIKSLRDDALWARQLMQ
jgi:uncharacterized membrane protein YqgA involved in biofilm formation